MRDAYARRRAAIPRCNACNKRVGSKDGRILRHDFGGKLCPGSGQKPVNP